MGVRRFIVEVQNVFKTFFNVFGGFMFTLFFIGLFKILIYKAGSFYTFLCLSVA